MTSPSASYEHVVQQHEQEKLDYYKRVHEGAEKESSLSTLQDMSIRAILQHTSQVFVSIMNELLSGQAKTYSDFINLFFKEGRPIYIGLILVFIAFSLYLIDITS